MRYGILALILLTAVPVFAQDAPQAVAEDKPVLIRSIEMEGFILGDKGRFLQIFKPYRNKHLTHAEMDGILKKIEIIYEREGYQPLVSIAYQVIKHRLIFTVSMTS